MEEVDQLISDGDSGGLYEEVQWLKRQERARIDGKMLSCVLSHSLKDARMLRCLRHSLLLLVE